MGRISAYILVATLTFSIGVGTFDALPIAHIPITNPSDARRGEFIPLEQGPRYSSRYENPIAPVGLLRVVPKSGDIVMDPQAGYDERALVIAFDDQAIAPQVDDPGAPTLPGFYLSGRVRLDFERVEVVGRKVYFRTRSVNGVVYEFSGASGEEQVSTSGALLPMGFIKGILRKSGDGKLESEEEIKFR